MEDGAGFSSDLRVSVFCSVLKTAPLTLMQGSGAELKKRWETGYCKDVKCLEPAGNGILKLAKICPKGPPVCAIIELLPEKWAPRPAFFCRLPSVDQSMDGIWMVPGPHLPLCIKATGSLLSGRQQAVGTWLTIYPLSTYLLSPTWPPNSQLPVQPPTLLLSLLSGCLGAWPKDREWDAIRSDIRGWKRGYRLNRKTCVG